MTTKLCSACSEEKPTSEFRRARAQPDRLSKRCAECIDAGKLTPPTPGAVCSECKERPPATGRKKCYKCACANRDPVVLSAQRRARWEARRQRILLAYGGKCVVCGESDLDVLLLDHVNDDGNEHRSKVGNDKVYHDLEANGYPPVVQVLCGNDDLRKRRGRFGSTGR